MDSPKPPFLSRGLFCPANTTRLEAKDDLSPVGDQESNVSLQLSLSCDYMSKNNKGKEKVSSERNFEVVVGEKIKGRSPLEPNHVSLELGLGLSLSGDSIIMSEEKKTTAKSSGDGGCSSQFQRENHHRVLKPKIGGLSLQLSLGPNGACGRTSKKRPEASKKRSVSSPRNKRTKVARQEETMTELRLGRQGDDPWCIRKILCNSDLGHLSRLLLKADLVRSHILPFWNTDQRAKIFPEGLPVLVWDCDTKTEHELVFKQWNKGGANVLNNKWITDFVKRRKLKKGDEIGLYWDESTSRFKFSVLNRSVAVEVGFAGH